MLVFLMVTQTVQASLQFAFVYVVGTINTSHE